RSSQPGPRPESASFLDSELLLPLCNRACQGRGVADLVSGCEPMGGAQQRMDGQMDRRGVALQGGHMVSERAQEQPCQERGRQAVREEFQRAAGRLVQTQEAARSIDAGKLVKNEVRQKAQEYASGQH